MLNVTDAFVKENEMTDIANQDPTPLEVIAAALRRERARVGVSLSELAKRAGVAKSTLSALEGGSGNPSVETLWALAMALDVPFSQLVDPTPPPVRVIRAGEGPTVFSEHANYTCTLLSSGPANARRDLYLINAQPGAARESEPHMPGVVEHVVLGSGRALVGPLDDPVELTPGDYCAYPGDRPHVFRALVADTTATMASEHR